MRFRFSMKWLLAAMVYVAVVAAAFTQGTYAWANLLSCISYIAIWCSYCVAMCATGSRRARAWGFLVGSLGMTLAVTFGPLRKPIKWVGRRLSPQVVLLGNGTLENSWSATAVAILLTGIVGSVLAATAYRQCRSTPNEQNEKGAAA
jgi:hypothetical protein